MSPLVRNVVSLYAARVLSVATSLFLFPFIVRHLGLTEYGLWLLISGITTFFVQTDLGMGTSAVRYIAEVDTGSPEGLRRMNSIVSSTVAFFAILAVVVTVIFATVVAASWNGFHVPDDRRSLLLSIVVIVAVGQLLIGLPVNVFRMVLVGLHRMDIANGLGIVQTVLRVGLICGLLIAGTNVLGVVAAEVGISLAISVLAYLACRRLVPQLRVSRRLVSRALFREMLPYTSQVFVIGISGLVILETNSYLIGLFLPVAFVTLYAGAWRIYYTLRDITGTMMNAVLPESARAWSTGDRERVRQLLTRGTKYGNAIVLAIAVPVFVFAQPLLVLWAGTRFTGTGDVLQILLVALVVGNNHLVALGLMLGVGRVKRFARYHVLWSASNLILAIILVPNLKLTGMALALTIPVVVLEPLYIHAALQELEMRVGDFIFAGVVPAFLPALLASPAVVIPQLLWSPTSLLAVAATAMLFVAVYTLLFGVFGLNRDERARVLRPLGAVAAGSR